MGLLKGMHEHKWQPVLDVAQCKIAKLAAESSTSGDCIRDCSAIEPHADTLT